MRSLMLECLPDIGEKRSIAKAVPAARALSVGPVCLSQAAHIQTDMVNAANALLDVSTSSSPTGKELSQMTTWLVLFHKRIENFAWVNPDNDHEYQQFASSSSSVKRGTGRVLYGGDSIKFRLSRCKAVGSGQPEEQDLQQLKMYRWCLSEAESKQLDLWLSARVLSSRDRLMNRQKALRDAEKCIQAKRGSEDALEDKAPGPPLKKVSSKAPKKLQEDNDEEEEEAPPPVVEEPVAPTGLCSFFGAKAI